MELKQLMVVILLNTVTITCADDINTRVSPSQHNTRYSADTNYPPSKPNLYHSGESSESNQNLDNDIGENQDQGPNYDDDNGKYQGLSADNQINQMPTSSYKTNDDLSSSNEDSNNNDHKTLIEAQREEITHTDSSQGDMHNSHDSSDTTHSGQTDISTEEDKHSASLKRNYDTTRFDQRSPNEIQESPTDHETTPDTSTSYKTDQSTKTPKHEDSSDHKMSETSKSLEENNGEKQFSRLEITSVLGSKVDFDDDDSDIENFDFGLDKLDDEEDININANHITPTDWVPLLENYIQVLNEEIEKVRRQIQQANDLKILEEQLKKRGKDDFDDGEEEKMKCANLEFNVLTHINSLPVEKQKIVLDVDRDGIPDFNFVDIEHQSN